MIFFCYSEAPKPVVTPRPERLVKRLKSVTLDDANAPRLIVLRQPRGPDSTKVRPGRFVRFKWKWPLFSFRGSLGGSTSSLRGSGSVPSSGEPRQSCEGVLAHLPTFVHNPGLSQEPSTSHPRPPQTELPHVASCALNTRFKYTALSVFSASVPCIHICSPKTTKVVPASVNRSCLCVSSRASVRSVRCASPGSSTEQ